MMSALICLTVAELMRDQPEACLVVAMHGVGAGTHNSFIDLDEYGCLIEWIAAQHQWL